MRAAAPATDPAELAKTAAWVLGVDQALDAVEFARENYRLPNLRFAQASVAALPHRGRSFDLVVAFEVIEHLETGGSSCWRCAACWCRPASSSFRRRTSSTTRRRAEQAGPNPFHHHEFEFEEFRDELGAVFPHISLFLENHVEGVVFQPVESGETAEVRCDGAKRLRPPRISSWPYARTVRRSAIRPSYTCRAPANVLREREQHIGLLEHELEVKNEWLEKAKQELADLNGEHQTLLEMFRQQKAELEASNQWAQRLNRELEERASAHRATAGGSWRPSRQRARTVVEGYEAKILDLEEDIRQKTAVGAGHRKPADQGAGR